MSLGVVMRYVYSTEGGVGGGESNIWYHILKIGVSSELCDRLAREEQGMKHFFITFHCMN
jgi:hypothetical protein